LQAIRSEPTWRNLSTLLKKRVARGKHFSALRNVFPYGMEYPISANVVLNSHMQADLRPKAYNLGYTICPQLS
jgi:hypothetical protein